MTVFILNKYTKIYINLCHRALTRPMPEEFTEKHHIIPRSLGGQDIPDNLVSVTPREHYILHLLLTKMTMGQQRYKMVSAAWWMCNPGKQKTRNYRVNSRIYETIRETHRMRARACRLANSHIYDNDAYRQKIANTLKRIGHNHKTFLERHHTEESKRKISEANKGKRVGSKNNQYGKHWITNGTENKMVPKDIFIPERWYKGRHYPKVS